MTTKCIPAEENDVNREHDCAYADPESMVEPERFPNVVTENQDENEREIQEIAMDVLHDERKRALTEIGFARFTNRAGGRVRPERFIISAAIVIAGQPKSARRPKN